MALVPHKITALAQSDADGTDGSNIVAGAVVSLYDTTGSAVYLYDDESGSNGSTAKQTDSSGQVVVWVTPGEYDEAVNGSTLRRISIFGNNATEVATFAELELYRPYKAGQVFVCQERANAKYIVQAAGYTAQVGDVTFANGRVGALQIGCEDVPDKFGSFADAIDRLNVITGRQDGEYEVPAFTIPANKTLKNINLKYSGLGGEDFITLALNADADNITIEDCVIDATGADDAIRGGKNPLLKIKNNEIFGCEVVGIQITGSAGSTDNEGLEITGNYIHDTGHDSLEIRSSLNGKIEGNTFENWGAVNSTSAAVELQEQHENTSIQFNTLINTHGDLFGVESAGDTARLINCQISNNIMRGAYTGISGKIESSSITNNMWYGGNGNWRSGIEVIGDGNTIRGNSINDGAISLASNGDGSVGGAPALNTIKTIIEGNKVRCTLENGRALLMGAVDSSTGTPENLDVDIKNNTFDMSDASGTGTRVLLIGKYTNPAQIDNINMQGNTIIGPAGVSSTQGIRTECLSGSGTVNIKLNTIVDVSNAVVISDDNLARVNIRFNDLSQGVNTPVIDNSTTTIVTNSDNDT